MKELLSLDGPTFELQAPAPEAIALGLARMLRRELAEKGYDTRELAAPSCPSGKSVEWCVDIQGVRVLCAFLPSGSKGGPVGWYTRATTFASRPDRVLEGLGL